jgi:hypothetical protein
METKGRTRIYTTNPTLASEVGKRLRHRAEQRARAIAAVAQYREEHADAFDWLWEKCLEAGATEAEKEALLDIHAASALMGEGRTTTDEREGLKALILDVAMRLPPDSMLNALSVVRQMERVRLGVRGATIGDENCDPEGTVPSGDTDDY